MVTAIAAGVISYKAAVKSFRATTQDSDKNIFVTTITKERSIWRSELREHIALYAKKSHYFLNGCGDITELNYHKSHIIMRLNPKARSPNIEHEKDYALFKSVNSIYTICEMSKISPTRLNHELIQLEKTAQDLLKQEWRKSKEEAITGLLK